MSASDENSVKICLVGSSTVGKSCISVRLVEDTFTEQIVSTIGSAFVHKKLDINGEVVNVHVWDTAGQERFRALGPLHYRNASAIVLVYDITNEKTFESLRTVWLPGVRACARKDVVLAVVGNKLDLADRGRVVAAETARGYADILEAIFMETSAKTGDNVENVFTQVVLKIKETKDSSDSKDRPENVIRLPGSAEVVDGSNSPPAPGVDCDTNGALASNRPKRTCHCN